MDAATRHRRVMALFDELCELPADQRFARLAEKCPDDPDIRQHVEALLRHDEADHSLFKVVESNTRLDFTSDAGSDDFAKPDDHIGGYRIIRKIGQGGMGEVFEAEQESPRRRVALKVIRAGHISRKLIRRFEHEAYVLAQLQHPGIAHIYESGMMTASGREQPFFAMELIDGTRITTYADEYALTTGQRLALVVRVCDAVQHAHQKGIVHRDLKPANILVVPSETRTDTSPTVSGTGAHILDAVGQPKILDFGVARVTDGDLQAVTMQTEVGQIVGTLTYMSPEQVAGDSSQIDTRSDVYALGVILFQLLTDSLPLDLSQCSMAEAARIIRDEEPALAGTINKSLRGDVETILSKALEKEPDHRYASAAELAADIRRYLQDEPIVARPASAVYQLRKFARRNRGLMLGVIATFVAVIAGLITSGVLLVSVTRERDAKQLALEAVKLERDAKQSALEASEEVTAFFTDMLEQASPSLSGKDVTVRDMIDQAGRDIESRFTGRPLIEARIRHTMGATYVTLSEFELAAEQLQAALAKWDATPEAELMDRWATQLWLGKLRYYQDDYDATIEQLDELLAAVEANPDAEFDTSEVLSIRSLAAMRLGRYAEAREGLEYVIQMLEGQPEHDVNTLISVKSILAELFSRTGSEQTEEFYLELIKDSSRIRGPDHLETLLLQGNLAVYYRNDRRDEQALPLLREVYQGQRLALGDGHRQTLITVSHLAQSLAQLERTDEALILLDDALAVAKQVHGDVSATTLIVVYARGNVLRKTDNVEEAESALLESIDLYRHVHGETHIFTWYAENDLLIEHLVRGRNGEAVELGEAMYERMMESHGDQHPRYVDMLYNLGQAYLFVEDHDSAERVLLTAAGRAKGSWVGAVKRKLVVLYEETGRPDEASKWRDETD